MKPEKNISTQEKVEEELNRAFRDLPYDTKREIIQNEIEAGNLDAEAMLEAVLEAI